MKRFFILLIFFAGFGMLNAQDEHYTLYDMVPLSVNPAYTGAFSGTFRAGGLFRDQAPTFGGVFITPVIFIDAPIIKGFREYDWIGVGANIFQDQSGSLNKTKSAMMGSIAYHFGIGGKLPKKGKGGVKPKQFFTIGIQGGSVGDRLKGLEREPTAFASEISSGVPSVDRTTIGQNTITSFDLSAGLLYRAEINKTTNFIAGFAYNHILKPRRSFLGGRSNRVFPARIVGHVELMSRISDQLYIKPRAKYEKRSSSTEINVQSVLGLVFDKEKDIDLEAGVGYRVGNALEFLFGARFGAFKAGASFDLTLSDQADIDNRAGAFEVAVTYIAIIHKKPDPKPILMCPRL